MPIEYPEQTFWPSARVTLSIRFEEYSNVSGNLVGIIRGLKPSTQVKGSKDPRGNLVVREDPRTPVGIKRFQLLAPTDRVPDRTSFGGENADTDNLTHDIAGIIPRRAMWKQNGIQNGDSLDLEIRWEDMPIDSRIIRSCAVSFYLGTLTPDQFARGVQGETREGESRESDRQPLNLVPDTFVDVRGTIRSNLRFTGWVDKWEMTWNDGEPIVKLECTDNTRLMLSQKQPSKGSVSTKKPIDEAIAEYLAQFPQLRGITIEYRPSELARSLVPVLDKVLSNTAHVPDLGPPSQGAGGGENESIWDYLDMVVRAIGHTIRIDGNAVIIQPARSLLDGRAQPRSDDPYRSRELPSGRYDVRTFVWGRNVSEMTVSHEYTHRQTRGVEMRCDSPRRKKTLVARFPEKADRPIQPLPGGSGDMHWQVVVVHGVNDEATLKQIAENYYNNLFRNELKIELRTKNMSSFGGDYRDPDLLDMKPGDSFRVEVDQGPDTIFGQVESDAADERRMVQRLQALGYGTKFAEAAAQAYTDAGFQRVYLAKEIGITWDTDDGVAFEMIGINYVETRVDSPLDDPSVSPTATVPTARK